MPLFLSLEHLWDKLPALVKHEGSVSRYLFGVFYTYCQVNMFYFPFDTQTCYINITASEAGKVIMNGTFHIKSFYWFHENTMWTVIDYKVHNYDTTVNDLYHY